GVTFLIRRNCPRPPAFSMRRRTASTSTGSTFTTPPSGAWTWTGLIRSNYSMWSATTKGSPTTPRTTHSLDLQPLTESDDQTVHPPRRRDLVIHDSDGRVGTRA